MYIYNLHRQDIQLNQYQVAYIIVDKDCCSDGKPTLCSGIKVDSEGKQLSARKYDTSSDGLNMKSFSAPAASLAWNTADNTLGLVIARGMLNGHQGATTAVLDGKDMSVVTHRGWASSHSFGNSLHVGENGKFVGADIGDNFPRGINLMQFSKTSKKQSRVVYTFKTKHCTSDGGICYGKKRDKYTEISTGSKTFYKHSNDNGVRTKARWMCMCHLIALHKRSCCHKQSRPPRPPLPTVTHRCIPNLLTVRLSKYALVVLHMYCSIFAR